MSRGEWVVVILLGIAFVIVVAAYSGSVRLAETDGRTREQLVDRGLAEYVIVDAQTGTTEWRWKQ